MGKIRVKKDTKNLDNIQKGLKNIDPIIRVQSIKLMGMLIDAYSKGSNLSETKKNKKLTDKYKDIKKESGRNPIRDLNFSGKIISSFAVKKEQDASYSIGPRGSNEQKIMEGNIGYDSNLMLVSDKIKKNVVKYVLDRIKKGSKK